MTSNLTSLANYAAESIGVNDSGETMSAQQLSDSLTLVNMILDNWSSEQIQVAAVITSNFTLTAGNGTYGVGPTGSWVSSPTPLKIAAASLIMSNGVVTPIEVVSAAKWATLPDRGALSDFVRYLFYTPANSGLTSGSNGIAQVSPVPHGSSAQIEAKYWAPLGQFPDTTTTEPISPGYILPLQWALAKALTSYFDVPWSAENESQYQQYMNRVRQLNSELWGIQTAPAPATS